MKKVFALISILTIALSSVSVYASTTLTPEDTQVLETRQRIIDNLNSVADYFDENPIDFTGAENEIVNYDIQTITGDIVNVTVTAEKISENDSRMPIQRGSGGEIVTTTVGTWVYKLNVNNIAFGSGSFQHQVNCQTVSINQTGWNVTLNGTYNSITGIPCQFYNITNTNAYFYSNTAFYVESVAGMTMVSTQVAGTHIYLTVYSNITLMPVETNKPSGKVNFSWNWHL